MNNIEDLKIIYDKENKEYVKAYVTIDGTKNIVTDNDEIKQLVIDLKNQKGVKSLKEIPDDYSLAFATNQKAIDSFDNSYADVLEEEPMILYTENPYDNCETKEINKNHLKKAAFAVGGALLVSALAFTGCKLMKSKAEPKEVVLEQEVLAKETTKVDPKSWENYVQEYDESMQKTFLTSKMDDITSNIVNMEINGKDYQLALAPEELVALNYYYNTFEMTNEDMLKTYGMYNLDSSKDSDLSNVVHNGLNKIRISLVKAKSEEDIIKFNFADEEVQKLYEKYGNLMIKYNTSDSKKKIKKEVENELKADFIENGSIDINEHPASSIILQLVPSAFNLENSPLSAKLNTILVGVETNFDVEDVKDSIEQNGLVDDACAPIDERLAKFDEYRQTLQNDSRIDERLNKELLAKVNMDLTDEMDQEYYNNSYVESELNTLTEDTYDLKETMIPLMNDYLSMEFELDANISFEEMNDEIIKEMIKEIQEQQQAKHNQPWNLKTNPAGGKKGDVLEGETRKNVPVSESQLSKEQIETAQKEFYEKNPEFVTPEEAEKIEQDYSQLCVQAWEAGQSETINGGPNASVNSTYANHSESIVRDAYYDGRNHGIEIYNSVHSNEPVTPENNQPELSPDLGEVGGTHDQNPNQNGNNQPEPTPQPEVQPEPEVPSEPELSPDLGEVGGSHDQNPNQGGSNGSSEIIFDDNSSDIIEGTITTDDQGVDDMSQYGDVQATTFSSEDISQIVDSYIEEMANPESAINNQEVTNDMVK